MKMLEPVARQSDPVNQTKVVMISSDENSSGNLHVTQNIVEPLFKVEKVPSNNSRSLGSNQSGSAGSNENSSSANKSVNEVK